MARNKYISDGPDMANVDEMTSFKTFDFFIFCGGGGVGVNKEKKLTNKSY